MMIRTLLVPFLLLCSATAYSQSGPQLSPLTQIYLTKAQMQRTGHMPEYVYAQGPDGQLLLSMLVKVEDAGVGQSLLAHNISIGTRAGKVWTLKVPLDQVGYVCNLPGLSYVQVDEPVHAQMDSARAQTKVDSVHLGASPLAMSYFGQDVVVGILDAGFDYTHPAFYDTSGTQYRVRRVWEQKRSGTPPAGFNYGRELVGTQNILQGKTDDSTISHGTHVAGIAAGSGFGSEPSGRQYRGMAPAADLVFVGINPDGPNWTSTGMADIIDGAAYVFNYAASVGKPAIVNLSWGCSIGPHDGASLFSQAMDALTGPGRLFACSAGNNGAVKLHLQKSFSAQDTLVQTFVGFSPNLGRKETWVDVWGDSAQVFSARIRLFSGNIAMDSTLWIETAVTGFQTIYLTNIAGDTCVVKVSSSPLEFNGKPRIFFNIENKSNSTVCLSIAGNSGKIHAWNGFVENKYGYYAAFTKNGKPWAVNGDSALTISDMATTRSILAVGAFTSKNFFTNSSGNPQSYTSYANLYDLAPFSSVGTTTDGRIKPDITAPGLVLVSAVNSHDAAFLPGGSSYNTVVATAPGSNGQDYSVAALMGTSMSSPAAAGILALMLQMKPNLTPDAALEAIRATAIHDSYTGPAGTGDPRWGWGKINAFGAMQYVSWPATITDVENTAAVRLWPNPLQDEFFLQFHQQVGGEIWQLSLRDASGKLIFTRPYTTTMGLNQVRFENVRLSAGVYYFSVEKKNGATTMRIVAP